MKFIATSALALALTAFGARAQTTTKDDSNAANPAAPSGEDKGTAGISGQSAPGAATTGAPGDSTRSSDVSPKTNGSGSAISGSTSPDTSSQDEERTTTTVKKHHKKHKKPLGRSEKSESGSMHRKSTSSLPSSSDDKSISGSTTSGSTDSSLNGDTAATKGSVQRPAAPGTTTPDTGSQPTQDPGMSKPGDVTGQPTDTQKPVDKGLPNSQPDKK